MSKSLLRISLILLFLFGFGLIAFFWRDYFSFESLQRNGSLLQEWTREHYFNVVVIYCLIYIACVVLCIPGAAYLTLVGGFLFGPIAIFYVVFSATLGSTFLFLLISKLIGEWIAEKASGWVAKMENKFQAGAFNYLLCLRLMPIFPFWVINIVAGLLAIPLKTFISATFIGIIPGTIVYVMVGNGLHTLLQSKGSLSVIFKPVILFPLLALAILSLLPAIYREWKKD